MEDLLKEALFAAHTFGIPEIVVYDYYDAFVQFVREELKRRIKYGYPTTKINTDIFMQVIMSEANIA